MLLKHMYLLVGVITRVCRRLALVLLVFSAFAHAEPQWRDVVQTVSIAADGSTIFDMTLTAVVTSGDFGEVFLCVDHGVSRLTLLPQSGVVRASSGGRAFSQPCDVGTEVVVRLDQRTSEARVRLAYRIDDSVDVYSDVVQWYWNLFPLERPTIVGYRLSLKIPGSMVAPFDAYVMRYGNPEVPIVSLRADRRRLDVHFDRIPYGDGVEVRYLMDPGLFNAIGSRAGFVELLRDQLRISNGW